MSLMEKVKFLWKKENVTSFKSFKDFFFIFLNLSGFNILRDEYFTGIFRKFLIIFTVILPITGFFTSFRVIWLYFDQVEEVIVSTVSWIMTFQAANKLIELAMHRKNHRQMIEIIIKNTESMQNDRMYFEIGVTNYKRARFYIVITTFAYLTALLSLWSYPFFPFLCRGEYKLAANVEWPFTNHQKGTGWAFNYVYSLVLTGSVAFLVLGKASNMFKFINFPRNCLSAYDILFYMYVFYITGRFEILGNQFQLIGDFSSSYNTAEKQQELIVNCLKIHADILA